MFLTSVQAKAFQNGVELSSAMINTMNDTEYKAENQMKEIKSGASIEVEVGYVLDDDAAPVEVEVAELFDLVGKALLAKTFDPAALS